MEICSRSLHDLFLAANWFLFVVDGLDAFFSSGVATFKSLEFSCSVCFY